MLDYRLETDRLLLRPPTMEDAPAIQVLVNDERIAKVTLNIPYPYPDNGAVEWLERVFARGQDDGEYHVPFAITRKADGLYMGTIGISVGNPYDASEVGYWLGVEFWGQGYMTEALTRMIQFGFEELKLNRIHAGHFADNPASGRVMKKAGMVCEGTLRQHIKKADGYKDLVYYGILREDYEQRV